MSRGPYKNTKTHCKNGHPFTKENTYIKPNGYRECRKCARIYNAKSRKMKGRFAKKELTDREKNYIRDNYQRFPVREIAAHLDITYYNVSSCMSDNGWKRTEVNHNEERKEIVMEKNGSFNYSGHPNWII